MKLVRNRKVDPSQHAQQGGIYTCSACGLILFEASRKFEVGSGFPSFWAQVGEHVQQRPLNTYGRQRIQLLCQQCGQHLGHLFEDARTPTNMRYCVNANSITFYPEQQQS